MASSLFWGAALRVLSRAYISADQNQTQAALHYLVAARALVVVGVGAERYDALRY